MLLITDVVIDTVNLVIKCEFVLDNEQKYCILQMNSGTDGSVVKEIVVYHGAIYNYRERRVRVKLGIICCEK